MNSSKKDKTYCNFTQCS